MWRGADPASTRRGADSGGGQLAHDLDSFDARLAETDDSRARLRRSSAHHFVPLAQDPGRHAIAEILNQRCDIPDSNFQ